MKLTDLLEDVGRPVAYYPNLRRITRSITANLLICQLVYWNGKQADKDGWIYKTSDELEEETGLSYEEQKNARRQLVKLGFLEEKYDRLRHRMNFRVNTDAINAAWEELTS